MTSSWMYVRRSRRRMADLERELDERHGVLLSPSAQMSIRRYQL